RAPTDTVDPSSLGDVALDDRTPAAELHETRRRVVLAGELTLLVVAGAVATLVHGGAEEPAGPECLVEGDHRSLSGRLVQEVQDRLGEVVRVGRAPGHTDDREPGLGLPVPPQIV